MLLGEGGWRSGASLFEGVRLAEIIHDDVEYGEEGVHIEHVKSAPFPSGLVGKPTLMCGHLPLKSSPCNSHQAFDPPHPVHGVPTSLCGDLHFVGGGRQV